MVASGPGCQPARQVNAHLSREPVHTGARPVAASRATVLSFAQYAVLLWVTPVVLVLIGIARFSHARIPPAQAAEDTYGAEPAELPERRTSV